jgi:hypothetical protein
MMSSSQTASKAKNSLATLMQAVEPIIQEHVDDMEPAVIDYILANYRNYLKINLEPDFEKARSTGLKDSPFDDLLKDFDNG